MRLHLNDTTYIDTDQPIDISLPLHNKENPVLAWYCEPMKIEPVMTDQFVGDVNQGGAVNFRNIFLNPHGNGTHTECVGHISTEDYTINQCLKSFHFHATIISIQPASVQNQEFDAEDLIITRDLIENKLKGSSEKVLIIRSLPNEKDKRSMNYSNSNPPYLSKEAIEYINKLQVEHLMVDMPSIDREQDNGLLIGHHTFWNYPDNPQSHKTITELIFVPKEVQDGSYFCNIQITSLESDASPSKICLYEIHS